MLLTVFTRSVPYPTGFALACQTDKGLGPEVNYLALRRAEDTAAARHLGATTVLWYRDTPYIIRQPDAQPALDLPAGLTELALPLSDAALAAKVAASQAYVSQLGFQFGDAEQVRIKLTQLAVSEGQVVEPGQAAERFTGRPGVLPRAWRQAKAVQGGGNAASRLSLFLNCLTYLRAFHLYFICPPRIDTAVFPKRRRVFG